MTMQAGEPIALYLGELTDEVSLESERRTGNTYLYALSRDEIGELLKGREIRKEAKAASKDNKAEGVKKGGAVATGGAALPATARALLMSSRRRTLAMVERSLCDE